MIKPLRDTKKSLTRLSNLAGGSRTRVREGRDELDTRASMLNQRAIRTQ